MKQVTITTGKVTIVVVDLPVNASRVNVIEGCFGNEYNDQIVYNVDVYTPNQKLSHIEQFDLPKGKWKHIGNPSQLTEEEWIVIVDSFELFGNINVGYKNYYQEEPVMDNATESGLSLLKSNGVLLENKYQDDWDELCIWGHGDFSKDGKSSFELYTEEQEQVWSNPQIFVKL